MFMPTLPLCQLALGLFVFHLCLASMKMFRHSETALPDYWKMGFLERLRLFAGTQEGAEASACLYSLIETAKANNLEPYKYLRYLFEKLPFASSEDDYRVLLPYNLSLTDLTLGNTGSGV